MPLGKVIKAYREMHGWSQSDLARQSGVPQATISRVERDLRTLRAYDLGRIATAFNLSSDELLRTSEIDTDDFELRPTEEVPSKFIAELQQLEHQLSPQHRAILIKIARALAFEEAARRQNARQSIPHNNATKSQK